ncbi:uracil-DNA glycosylase-like protein [Piptocephalis cylindrospora]|uniref:Uracil-DNA glycosylase-like protein n=1 Tax=Piptocephalis cylindrospora TaxID=1907219 RepID=A0A4P9Y623_9FUNG|nr:uracil-DNA glycosylase-like protein [Piptocephalis cylindrospora]|eukprot:RKP14457.1 uracil-DNA glycosylase-like protein [Piptocephalis cylindrospora]
MPSEPKESPRARKAVQEDEDEVRERFRQRLRSYLPASSSTPKEDKVGAHRSSKRTAPTKQKGLGKNYAPPETYAHLPQSVPDHLGPKLRILFVGINPGVASAKAKCHYANPTNLFWPYLRLSGLVDETTTFKDGHILPEKYGLGLTNIVSRPSKSAAELSKMDYQEGAKVLQGKIRECQPRIVCFVGKGIYEHYTSRPCASLGLQMPEDATMDDDDSSRPKPRVFVMPSTSGLAAGYSREVKKGYFHALRDLLDEIEGSKE